MEDIQYFGGNHQYYEGYSVLWGIPSEYYEGYPVLWRDTISAMDDFQYLRGIISVYYG